MDDKTSVSDLKRKVRSFCDERDWGKYHNAKDLAIGIITESSELLEHFRFQHEDVIESKKAEISEEMSDVLFFLLLLAERNNIDLTSELAKKLDKNSKNYPISKSKGVNKKYSDL